MPASHRSKYVKIRYQILVNDTIFSYITLITFYTEYYKKAINIKILGDSI